MSDDNIDEEQLYWMTLLGTLDSQLKAPTNVNTESPETEQEAMQSYLYLDLVQSDFQNLATEETSNDIDSKPSAWLVGKEINDEERGPSDSQTNEFSGKESGSASNENSHDINSYSISSYVNSKSKVSAADEDFSAFQSRFLNKEKKKTNSLYKGGNEDVSNSPSVQLSTMDGYRRNDEGMERSEIVLLSAEEDSNQTLHSRTSEQNTVWKDDYSKNLYALMKKEMMFEELEDPSVSPIPNPPNRHNENFVPMITEEEYELNRSQNQAKKNKAKVDFVVELPETTQETTSNTAWYGKIAEYLHTAKQSLPVLNRTNETALTTRESANDVLPKLQEASKWATKEMRKYSYLTYQTIVAQLNDHLYMNSLFTIVREMTHNALDRTDHLTEQYITLPVSLTNQEWKYFEKISKASTGWEQLFIRYSMATIHWKQRQLLKETRDENYYQYLPLLTSGNTMTDRSASTSSTGNANSMVKEKLLALIVDSSQKQELASRVFGDSKIIVRDGVTSKETGEGNDDIEVESKNRLHFISSEEKESFFPTIKELVQLEMSSSTADHGLIESDQNSASGVFEPMHEYTTEDMLQLQMQNYLVKYFTPPPFQLGTECSICLNPFSVTCFRHHCRYCGRSVCSDHSRQKRRLLRFGIIPRVRVCNHCIKRVDERHMYDELLWKDGRLTAYLANELIPYIPSSVSIGGWDSDRDNSFFSALTATSITATGKSSLLNSIVQGTASKTTQAISFAKQAFSQYSAKLLPATANIFLDSELRPLFSTYIDGLKASFAVEERNNSAVFQLLNFLRHSFRFDQLFLSMSSTDSMFVLYLKLLLDELMVAEHPNYFQIVNRVEKNTDQSKEKNINYELSAAVKYASLALLVIYQGNAYEMQRLGKLQGLDLIFTNIETNYEDYDIQITEDMSLVKKSVVACLRKKPIYALFGTSATNSSMYQQSGSAAGIPRIYKRKEIVFVIRGDELTEKQLLFHVHEYEQDFHNIPILFPPSKETILALMSGENLSIEEIITVLRERQDVYNLHQENEEVDEECVCFANYEMAVLALWALKEIGPSITRLLSSFHQNEQDENNSGKGHEISFLGHGLGGSIATLLTVMLHSVWDLLQDITSNDPTKPPIEDTVKRVFHPGHLQCVSYGALACLAAPTAYLLPPIYSVIMQNDLFVSLSFSLIRRYFHAEMSTFHTKIFQPLLNPSTSEDSFLVDISNEEEFWFKLLQQMLKTSPFYSRFAMLCNSNEQGISGNQRNVMNTKANTEAMKDNSDDEDDMIMIGEPLPVLTVPGKVLYLYQVMGQWRVSSNQTFFQHLLLNRNMLVHHIPRDVFHALLECRAQHYSQSSHPPPYWSTTFSTNHCACCKRRFEWPSSLRGDFSLNDTAEQKNAEVNGTEKEGKRLGNDMYQRYNCYHCGEMICGNCNRTSVAIPKFAMIFPKPICDTCVLSSEFAQM